MRQSVFALALVTFGLLAGFFLGRLMPAPTADNKPAVSRLSPLTNTTNTDTAPTIDPGMLASTYSSVSKAQQANGLFERSMATHALAASADVTQLELLIRDAATIEELFAREDALTILFKRYADIDAEAAFTFASSLPNDKDRWHAHAAVMKVWSQTDPLHAIKVAATVPEVGHRDSLINVALKALLRIDPELALAETENLPERTNGWIPILYTLWAREDAIAALNHANTITNMNDQAMAKQVVAYGWVRLDPEAVLAWLTNADQEEDRNLVMLLGSALAQNSPEMAANIARQMSNTQSRNGMLGNSVRELARLDPQRAVAQLDGLTGSARRMALGRITMEWTERDPSAALEWAKTLPEKEAKKYVPMIAGMWADKDLDSATAAILNLSADARRLTVQTMARKLGKSDPVRGFEWLRQIEGGEIHNRALGDFVSSWTDNDPTAAIALFSTYESEDWMRPAINMTLSRLATANGPQASQWVDRFTNPAVQNLAAQSVARGWARVDRNRAITWAEARAGIQRDAALAGIVSTMDEEYEAALPLANSIRDYKTRDKALSGLLYRAVVEDKKNARSFLDAADFDAARRKQLAEHFGI